MARPLPIDDRISCSADLRIASGNAGARSLRSPRRARRGSVSLALFVWLACATAAHAFPEIGYLQFKVEHNLETDACLGAGTCFIDFEEKGDPTAWLSEIRGASNLGVLHWDRGIPWLAFDPDPPQGADRVSFYDARIDAQTLLYLNAFEAHFAALGRGYVAVSILSGERDRLAPLYLGPDTSVPFTTTCPDFTPGTLITVDPGTGPVVVDLERSYRNFILYLAEKLSPDYLALLVEANLIELSCAPRAASLYALYRALHDDVRAELGAGPTIFATLGLQHLLAYGREACYPTSAFVSCATPPGPSFPDAGPAACFPLEAGAIAELSLGGRLDVLALSFYPDSLEMNPLPGSGASSDAYLLAEWNDGGACTSRLDWPDVVDPLAAIDLLGWSGPIAFAVVSSRSCYSPMRFDLPNPPSPDPLELVVEVAGSADLQAEWTSRMLRTAIANDYLFFAHSFLRDYPPVGPWIVDQGVATGEVQRLINIWPCSGIQDGSGALKPEMAAIGLPEPDVTGPLAFGVLLLAALRSSRTKAQASSHRR